MTTLLTVIHVTVCVFLIIIVLLQHGKGADIGATFGGASNTLFGTEGPMPMMNKVTTGAAIVFMMTSIALAFFSSHRSTGSVMSDVDLAPPPIEQTFDQGQTAVPITPAETAIPEPTPADGGTSEAAPGNVVLPRSGTQSTNE